MNIFKKIASLNYAKDILPLQMLKKPDKILILFPMESCNYDLITKAIGDLKNEFSSSEIIGIVNRYYGSSIGNTRLFGQIISYDAVPKLFSRRFFRLRDEIRNLKAPVSIDLNLEDDLLSWLSGAALRIGCMSSPFINYRIRLKETGDGHQNTPEEVAGKIVKILCTSR